MIKRLFILLILLLFFSHPAVALSGKSIIYRGNEPSSVSLPAVLSASLQAPDFIELPLMLSRDDRPVVFSDLVLQHTTNVARVFPERNREDGNFYPVDFTLEELERLSYLPDAGKFGGITTHLSSMDDMLKAIDILASQQNLALRILPVVKYPWFHKNEGRDISSVVLRQLIALAGSAEDPLFLASFDPDELQRISKDILPGLPVEVRLVQAIDTSDGMETMRLERGGWTTYNYEWFFTRLGLRVAANYADILYLESADIVPADSLHRFISDSQGLKMKVFIAAENASSDDFEVLLFQLNGDGLAVSDPGPLRRFLDSRKGDGGYQMDGSGGGPDAILSNPEALMERLKNAQQAE